MVSEQLGDRAALRWGVDVGDRVAVETIMSCRFCSQCLAGHYSLCKTRRMYSYVPLAEPPSLWGSYAEYMYIDKQSIVRRVDASLSPELAVMFNPLGAGFRWGVEIPGTGPGDSVLICGPGQRGLASVLACREAGATQIFVTGLAADAHKLELALAFRADATLNVQHPAPPPRRRHPRPRGTRTGCSAGGQT